MIWVSNPRNVMFYYAVQGHICKLRTKNISRLFRRIGITRIVIFPREAREPTPQYITWSFALKRLDADALN